MIGCSVLHYKIVEKLGEGGMGVVYKAQDTKLKRTVALKFLPPGLTQDQQAKERFLIEAQATAALNHSNIVTVYEIGECEQQVYIAIEYLQGETLKEKINAGPLKINDALQITTQVAEGLKAAHEKRIFHRDIKSANIMTTEKGLTKIMDFGLAKLKGQSKTSKRTMMGTTPYMSPEQLNGGDVDHRADIWSLGVVLYEMLAGQLPFNGEYEPAITYSIVNEDPEPLTALRTDVPMELERIVNKSLSKDPNERYQHIDNMLVELGAFKESIAREKNSEVRNRKKPSRTQVTVTVAITAIVAVLFFLYIQMQKPVGRKKIVVLPFENLGSFEVEYFADGITGEITSRLAAVSGLGVISRTSAVQYDSKSKTMTQIGEDLGVDYVLEGTVRWDGGDGEKSRVRVTPMLIRVSDDTQIWSKSYDHVIEDIFMVQSQIAKSVIRELDITLLEPEQRALDTKPTNNLEAYNAYLRGLKYLAQPGYLKKDKLLAMQMFKRAVKIDPGFTLAYGELSKVHSEIYQIGYDHTKERIAKAKAAVDRALELQPELPEVHMARGYYLYWCHNAYERALKEFEIARKGLPNETSILHAIAFIRRRQGQFDKALEHLKSAVELNPRDAELAFELGVTYWSLRKYSKAVDCLDRSITIAPEQIFAYGVKTMIYWSWRGDLKMARETLKGIPRESDEILIYFWFFQEIYERRFPEALSRANSLSEDIYNAFDTFMPKSQMAGYIYQYMKEPEPARTSFESARILLEKEMKKKPDDPRIHSSLGIVYAALGRRKEAIREGEKAVELSPVSKDALWGPSRIRDSAHICVILGEYDTAITKLDYLLSIPSWYSVPLLRLDPMWDPLREHPKFQRLLEKYRSREQ